LMSSECSRDQGVFGYGPGLQYQFHLCDCDQRNSVRQISSISTCLCFD